MDIAAWLRGLGLEHYEPAFRENAIDETALPRLTGEDLKEIGVGPVGHRRKLLDAIAAIGALASPPASSAARATGAPPKAGPAVALTPSGGERRQITVMFCDLVGSTALSARLDPEDMSEIVRAYCACCADLIAQAGGFVAKYMGDGVLAYFGYPQAHEHDAEHAVRAGLAVVDAVPKLTTNGGAPLQVRVGIATGLVVVGDLIGSGEAQERGIAGETPNLAARLQALAEPNSVVIAESTRRLLGSLFELKDLGHRDLEGIAEPALVWAVLAVSPVESRFEALHTTDLTAFVGREEESELLLRRWATAKRREGQVVLLCGEAGIGKSRLTATLVDRLGAETYTRLRYFCSPQRMDSALHPIIEQIERAAALADDDTPCAQLDKLDAMLSRTSTSPEDAALFASAMSLPNDGRYPALALTSEQLRQRTLDAFMRLLVGLARQQSVLMILEDAHWIDPTSLEVFGRAVDLIKTLPVLLIVTFRPEFHAPWVGQSHVTILTLNRLGKREAASIIARLAGNTELPVDVRSEIVERSDGIPLFVEEMTKAVLEAEGDSATRRTAAAVPCSAPAVPASLHASLMARLDRLGSAKEVAQIASAIGREFSHRLLASVARKPEMELESALERVVQAGLLFRHGVAPQASYVFKHALVQDAAYGTLLREPRRALHARIAETLESQFAETVESGPEIVAHHCTEAGLVEKAATLWGKAGRQSLMRSALAESIAQFTRALAQIAMLPSTPARRRDQIELQVALITSLTHRYGAAETKGAAEQARLLIERAEALGEPPEDPLLLFSVLFAFWMANFAAFHGDLLCNLAMQFLTLAGKQNARVPLTIGHRLMGTSLLLTGDIAQGRAHFDQAIALYEPAEHRPLTTRFAQDAGVATLVHRSWALWLLGYPEAALRDADDALKNAREMGQAATLMLPLRYGAITYILCGDHGAAAVLAQELTALADEKESPFYGSFAMAQTGIIFALTGKASDAIEMLLSAIAARRTMGATSFQPFFLLHLARAYADLGQFEQALACIGDATTAAETTAERWCEAEIHRMAGEVTLLSAEPDAAKAQAHFERALAIAGAQQAKSWELRAATSLARFWSGQGKRWQARDLLAPIYGWFSQGFDTLDLQQAKALLDDLAQ